MLLKVRKPSYVCTHSMTLISLADGLFSPKTSKWSKKKNAAFCAIFKPSNNELAERGCEGTHVNLRPIDLGLGKEGHSAQGADHVSGTLIDSCCFGILSAQKLNKIKSFFFRRTLFNFLSESLTKVAYVLQFYESWLCLLYFLRVLSTVDIILLDGQ